MDVFIQTVKHNSPHKDRASSHLQKPGPDACRSTLGRMRAAVVLDSAYILAALAALLIVIATLGALGFGVGFDVFPIGEDNNWIDMLQRGRGAEVARLFWTIDHRNPLSPWWYIAARPIILGFDAGLLALRYAIAAVLALAAYCMVVTVAGRRARAFALGVAMVSVVWMANRFTEQVIWNFQGALAASVLSVAAYARFVEEGRRSYRLYAVSMVLWFVAFATYSNSMWRCSRHRLRGVSAGARVGRQRTAFRPQARRHRLSRHPSISCVVRAVSLALADDNGVIRVRSVLPF